MNGLQRTSAAEAVIQKQAVYRSGKPLRHPNAKGKSKCQRQIQMPKANPTFPQPLKLVLIPKQVMKLQRPSD
jgi:hypothetical protein